MSETLSQGSGNQMKRFKGPAALLAAVLAVGGAGAYSVHEHGVAKSAQDQNAAILASLQSTSAQVQQLTAKLNDLSVPKPEPEVRAARPVVRKTSAHRATGSAVRHRADDPRWNKVQAQLDEQGKAIESTRSDIASTRNDLTTAKTELGDSIARTHGELVVLQRKGERNYFEFDLSKSKQFASKGSIGVRLRKANVKHQFADLELLVDDRSLTKKHVNIFEPAMFYSADSEHPIEVVIQLITKDHIRGYVSEPKYRRNELTAMSNGQDTNQQRQKLSIPNN
jgi:hypothetical protein